MKKTLVISDIHGMFDLFIKTLKDNDYNSKEDRLIILGDMIDRGEKSYEVVEYLKNLQKNNKDRVIVLRGNHEDMAITAYESNRFSATDLWDYNGSSPTLDSYALNGKTIGYHIPWLKSLPLFHKEKKFFFVHAGINPYKTLKNQDEEDLLWIREEFYSYPKKLPKKVVFGHTPFKCGHAIFKNGATGIDGGAYFSHFLTTLIINEKGKKEFYSSSMDSYKKMSENHVKVT